MSYRDSRTCRGLRVFAVEDESLVAMQLEDILEELGCEVAALAMKLSRALEALDKGIEADVAVLDVNIAGEQVYPVAERLRSAGVPILFATGYGRQGVIDEWQHCPVVQKPYTADQIEAAILEARS
ncbi:response regulator [Aureimonas sp. ME7]|uniref:response regulator n=1 Tax=Aureimonas sp. ME7 TaxID=2744252 RepID=UPI001FCEDBFF|nr:response regulator [Aureimonas sp. ME7]